MNDVETRDATPDDVEWMFEVHRLVFGDYIRRIFGWDEAWQRAQFKLEFESSRTSLITVAGKQVGYMQVDIGATTIHLRNLAVLPEWQNRQIGAHLVRDLQGKASDSGVPVTLSVFKLNERAARFYERLGFRATRETDTSIEMSWSA